MLYIFGERTDEGKRTVAVVTVEPIEGEEGEAEFIISEETEGNLMRILESDAYLIDAKVESENGMFDKHRLDHWAALPTIFRGGRFWVEELSDEEAEKYAGELGGFEEGTPEKGA